MFRKSLFTICANKPIAFLIYLYTYISLSWRNRIFDKCSETTKTEMQVNRRSNWKKYFCQSNKSLRCPDKDLEAHNECIIIFVSWNLYSHFVYVNNFLWNIISIENNCNNVCDFKKSIILSVTTWELSTYYSALINNLFVLHINYSVVSTLYL